MIRNLTLLAVLVLLSASCASTPPPAEPPPDIIGAATRYLADRYGEDPNQLEVLRAEELTWSSRALGCPDPTRAYGQATTPGFKLVLTNATRVREYQLHTNADGSVVVHCVDGRPAP